MSLRGGKRSMQQSLRTRSGNELRIAVICALSIEAGMVRKVLDEEWNDDQICFAKARGDNNAYTLGKLGQHSVVLVHMPGMGAVDAAIAVAGLRATFPYIEIAFLVGICGASPKNVTTQQEIYLGDCIVSTAVIQYDFGGQYPEQFKRKVDLEDSLGRAGPKVRSLLAKLQTPGTPQAIERELAMHLQSLQEENLQAHYPGARKDHLYRSTYVHSHHDIKGPCEKCDQESGVCKKDCTETGCDETRLVPRTRLSGNSDQGADYLPQLHFGRYGSANTVLKSGIHRDQYTYADKIIAFEMEAAGMWENIPTLVVKSVCDYADSHKNKVWQSYAAASAAAALKAILSRLEVSRGLIVQAQYDVPFSLERIPITKKFIDRPHEMREIEETLLPSNENNRRKLFVLRGLGGIGKTQLAVEFMRRHHSKFSAVFWLDGSTVDSLKRSIAQHAVRIPTDQISKQSREYTTSGQGDLDLVVAEVFNWLVLAGNHRWLLVFDNVDREFAASSPDPLSYDIKKYIPSVDHGSVLVTTRLAQLERFGESQEVKKVDDGIARAILRSWHDTSYDKSATQALLTRLDGLPLAIAQAGAYLHQKGVSITTYLRLYDEQQTKVVEALHKSDTLLGDYPNRSVWTTWNISYDAVLDADTNTANLLVLWSFLDRNDFWYGLFEKASQWTPTKKALRCSLGDIAEEETSFIDAMGLLKSYSLIEGSGSTEGHTMHTVVHRWMYLCHGTKHMSDLGLLAMKLVGLAVPMSDQRDYARLQQRLLPHADTCLSRTATSELVPKQEEDEDCLDAMHNLGILYSDQGKLAEAEQMYVRALAGKEKTLGAEHTSTLDIVNNLGILYSDQGKLAEAEQMYVRALAGYEKTLGAEHTSTLDIVNNLGVLYSRQGKLAEAEPMYARALAGYEKTLGAEHTSTLMTVNNLGILYADQGKLAEAEKMYVRALAGYEKALGAEHISTFDIVNNLGNLYNRQGKLAKAERMYVRALAGKEKTLGAEHTDTLTTVNNLGNLYYKQGKLAEAERMLLRALTGYEKALGAELVKTYIPALSSMWSLGDVYSASRPQEAQAMLERALAGYTIVRGDASDVCLTLNRRLDELAPSRRSNKSLAETSSQASVNKRDASATLQPKRRFASFRDMMRRTRGVTS